MVSNVSIIEEKINILTDYDISLISPIKCGGKAKYITFPNSIEQIQKALEFAKSRGLKTYILGGLTNTIVCDNGINGLAICTNRLKGITIENNIVNAICGESLSNVINFSINNNLSGLESLSGIPGTIGGAVKGNAGSYDRAISDVFYYADIILSNGEIKRIYNDEKLFSYRSSAFLKDCIIYSISLKLKEENDNKELIKQRDNYLKIRKEKGQYEKPSLGCVFKNLKGISAGSLIEKCGLKGTKINGSEVSINHANFICVNEKTTAKDYLTLSKLLKDKVKQEFNIDLEYEINILCQD